MVLLLLLAAACALVALALGLVLTQTRLLTTLAIRFIARKLQLRSEPGSTPAGRGVHGAAANAAPAQPRVTPCTGGETCRGSKGCGAFVGLTRCCLLNMGPDLLHHAMRLWPGAVAGLAIIPGFGCRATFIIHGMDPWHSIASCLAHARAALSNGFSSRS